VLISSNIRVLRLENRVAGRLKQRFPRLPICLLLNGLFAGGPTFTHCEQSGWPYLITLQEGDLSSLQREFEALLALAPSTRSVKASMFKNTGATRWNTLTLRTRPPPKSVTSSCRSSSCSVS
jgi:hypothetical protein